MARESLASKRERAAAIEERMFEHYGPGKASLDYRTPFELTVAVVLSAQCTDAAVNKVTPRLFAAFPTPAAMAGRLLRRSGGDHPLAGVLPKQGEKSRGARPNGDGRFRRRGARRRR